MKEVLLYLWNRRTTVLGYIGIVLGVLAAAEDVFSPQTIKLLVLGGGLVTAVLGHYNNRNLGSSNDESQDLQ